MAHYTINKRNGKYTCQVRWTPGGTSKRKSKSKTFTRKATASAWGEKCVREIEDSALSGNGQSPDITLGQLLDQYLDDAHVQMGRSKRYTLNLIRDSDISTVPVADLKPMHIVNFCKDRSSAGVSPATIAADISSLRSVLKSAEALYDIHITDAPIVRAMPTLHSLKLVGKPQIRTRRPTADEIDRLKEGLLARQSKQGSAIPFVDILDFSILSCMRIGEVCSILWEDLNAAEGWVLVRNRKDPRKKQGNHMKVPLLGGALDIALRQEKTDDPRIFPYNSRSVTSGFQRVRGELGIEDLRYHDLRREGASRLFEKGYDITDVAQVTGHRDLNTLWRIYTNLHPHTLKDVTPRGA